MKHYSLKTTPVSSISIDDVKSISIHPDFILAFSDNDKCLFSVEGTSSKLYAFVCLCSSHFKIIY